MFLELEITLHDPCFLLGYERRYTAAQLRQGSHDPDNSQGYENGLTKLRRYDELNSPYDKGHDPIEDFWFTKNTSLFYKS